MTKKYSLGLVGRKAGMSRVFTDDGRSIPVTLIEATPNRITQIKTVEADGYSAVQVTTGSRRAALVNKPLAGHYAKAKVEAGRGLWEFRVADVTSTEARAKYHEAIRQNNHGQYYGLTFWSPNINIFRDPRWGRGQETYGEDPFLTGRLAVAFIKGMQGADPKYYKVIATAKHFAVHSGPESTRHSADVAPSIDDLNRTYLPAFRASIVGTPVCFNIDKSSSEESFGLHCLRSAARAPAVGDACDVP